MRHRLGDPLWRTRPARLTDRGPIEELLTAANALHAQIRPDFFRLGITDVEPLLRQSLAGPHETVLVAEDEHGEICGFGQVEIVDTPTSQMKVQRRRARLETLIVAERSRRRGCGRALLFACEEWARRRGATQLLLTVWSGNGDAERFYASVGYGRVSQVLGTDL